MSQSVSDESMCESDVHNPDVLGTQGVRDAGDTPDDIDMFVENELNRQESGGQMPGRLVVNRIEIENFKSYYGTRTIGPFHKGFSCVIGANGSGKSNVIDSMLFVFGYRAQKIRGQKVATLIHNSALHGQAKTCKVSVFFLRVENRGRGRDCYAAVPGTQFVVSRIAFRTGSTNYQINGCDVRFAEVKKQLLKHGVNVDSSRFLILQGEVENIAAMGPKGQKQHEVGLLEFLEDLIGTGRYKAPLEMLIERCEDMSDVKVEKHNRVREAEKDVNEIRQSRDKAVDFLQQENEIFRDKYLLLGRKIKDLTDKNEHVMTEYTAAKSELAQIEENTRTLKKELEERKKTTDNTEKKMLEEEERSDEFRKLLREMEHNQMEDEKTLASNEKLVEQLTSDIRRDKLKIEELGRNTDFNPDKLRELRELVSEKKILLAEAEERLSIAEREAYDNAKPLRNEIDQVHKKQICISDQRNLLKAEYENALSIKASKEGDVELAKNELTTAQRELDKAQEAIPRLKSKLAVDEKSLSALEPSEHELRSRLAGLLDEENSRRNALSTLNTEIKDISDRRTKFQHRNKVLNFILKACEEGNLRGVYGRLGDLGFVDPELDCAVSTAGGGFLDYIVVDTMDTAQRCVEMLKREKIGAASFIGLDKQTGWRSHMSKRLNLNFAGFEFGDLRRAKHRVGLTDEPDPPGYELRSKEVAPLWGCYVCGYLVNVFRPPKVSRLFDLIKVPLDEVRPAFYFAFRDTLVATDLNQASSVAYGPSRYRVVTMIGELIEKSGTMSGGGRSTTGKIRTGDIPDVSFSGEISELSRMKAQSDLLQREYNKCKEEIDSVKQQMNSIQIQVTNLSSVAAGLRQEIEANQATIDINRVRLDRAKLRFNQLGSVREAGVTLEELVEKKRSAYEDISRTYDELRTEVARIKRQIEDEMDEQVRVPRGVVQNGRAEVRQYLVTIGQLENEIATSNRTLAKLEEKVAKNEQRRVQSVAITETVSKRLQEIFIDSAKLHKEFEECQLSLGRLKSDFEGQATDIRLIEEQILTIRNASIDVRQTVQRLEGQVTECTLRIEAMVNERSHLKLNEVYPGCVVEPFSDDPELLEGVNVAKLTRNIEERQRKHDQLKPDINSIQEFEIRNALYLQRKGELDQLMGKIRSFREKHEILRKRREDEFMSAFRIIARALKAIYRQLTLGGDADLELVDSLDPFSEGIEFSVRPPQKSWKLISNVSGGEKTLSSLALIFALHEFKPAAIYFMDEVDAALDFRNVSIIADFIRDRTLHAQFVVISLRLEMQEKCDHMLGVFKQQNLSSSSSFHPRMFHPSNKRQCVCDEELDSSVEMLSVHSDDTDEAPLRVSHPIEHNRRDCSGNPMTSSPIACSWK